MSTRSKEKVVAAFRKFFRSSEKISEQDGASSSTSSPSRRLLSRHRPDAVTPTDGALSDNPGVSNSNHGSCFFKSKKTTNNSTQVFYIIWLFIIQYKSKHLICFLY